MLQLYLPVKDLIIENDEALKSFTLKMKEVIIFALLYDNFA